ncbi:MAG: peptidase S16 [bacterium]|nr:peptidase S16 [bacterium]
MSGLSSHDPSQLEAEETRLIPDTIPVFPLPDTILLPGEVLPLHIFEPRYRDMIKDALDGHRVIGMVEPEAGHESHLSDVPPLRDHGCVGFIAEHQHLDDGRYLVWLVGLERFRIKRELSASTTYRQVQVDYLATKTDGDEFASLAPLRQELCQHLPSLIPTDEGSHASLVEQLSEMSDSQLLAFGAQVLELDSDRKRELLESSSLSERFMMVHEDLYFRVGNSASLGGLDPSVVN